MGLNVLTSSDGQVLYGTERVDRREDGADISDRQLFSVADLPRRVRDAIGYP